MAPASPRGDLRTAPSTSLRSIPGLDSSAFQKRRFQNWFFLGLMYAFFYMGRYNLSAVSAAVKSDFGWSYTQYGWIVNAGMFVYGCAVFLNGPLADRIGGKRAILIGAAGAAVFNVLFGLGHLFLSQPQRLEGTQLVQPALISYGMSGSTVIAMFAVMWACNNYFQSFGALSIVKINAAWFRLQERGKFAGIFGIMIQSGRFMAYRILPMALIFVPWKFAFFLPAVMLLVMWIVLYARVENTPVQAGYPELDTHDESADEAQAPATLSFVLRKVFGRPEPWLIALASMCIGMVRHSVDQWHVFYIVDVFGVQNRHLNSFGPYQLVIYGIPLAAVFGGLVAGNASDRLFGSRRAPVIFFAFLGQAVGLLLLRYFLRDAWAACLSLVFIALFVNSAHSLVGGAASMDFGGRKAVATAAGLFDGAQYLGGAVVGIGLGKMLDHYKVAGQPGAEFAMWPLLPLGFALVGAIVISRLWYALPGRSRHGHGAATAGPKPQPLEASTPYAIPRPAAEAPEA
jgi:OPA family glycerol-3-phosphate transporter-like MFS transporter